MKKRISLILVIAMLLGMLVPNLAVVAEEPTGKDVTAKVTQGLPDVFWKKSDGSLSPIITNGVLVAANGNLSKGHLFEIHYKWNIAGMEGIEAGDYFDVKLPDLTGLDIIASGFTSGTPINITSETNEVLGSFVVDIANRRLRATLNATAVGKGRLDNGKFMLGFQTNDHISIEVNNEAGSELDKILIKKRDVAVTPIGGTEWKDAPDFTKTGSFYNLQTNPITPTLGWYMKVNYDGMKKALEQGGDDVKKNVWVEDRFTDPSIKLVENFIRVYGNVFAATPQGKLSTAAIYTPPIRLSGDRVVKSNPGESYEDFKARAKTLADPSKPFVAFIYNAPAGQNDALLFYAGDLGANHGVSYSDLFGGMEKGIIDSLESRLAKGELNEEQVAKTKELYGVDGDLTTPLKKVTGVELAIYTKHDTNGTYFNTAKMTYDGGEDKVLNSSAKYAVASGSAGATDVISVLVKKVWEGKVGGEVEIELLQNG